MKNTNGGWVLIALASAVVALSGCASVEPTVPLRTSTTSTGCVADAMPARLQAEGRWTEQHEACRRDPDSCAAPCERGEGEACYAMGVGLQDRGQAAEGETYFERACLAGSAIGCTNFGAGLLKDATDPMAPAVVCAARLFERTCAAGERAWGCGMWGLVLSRGEGVASDPARALEVLDRACAMTEYFPCDVLGLAHRQGLFGEPSIDAARHAFARGCRGGYEPSCEALAALDAP